MLAVNGYFDGNVCLVDEKIDQKPQKVIITFLNEDYAQKAEKKTSREEKLQALREVQENFDSAVDEAFGLWKDHDDSVSVDEYVRNLRKGRQFDIR